MKYKIKKSKKTSKNDVFLLKKMCNFKFMDRFYTRRYHNKNITKKQKKYPSTAYIN